MIVIRRLTDRRRAYTAIFLKGEPPRIFPTSEQEHGRILEIYKQDKAYEGIHNDFTDFKITRSSAGGAPAASTQSHAQRESGS